MEIEEYIERISSSFSDPEEANCRIDSMHYLATEKGLGNPASLQLQQIADISRLYGIADIEALKLFESIYSKAIDEPRSKQVRYLFGSGDDPMVEVVKRVFSAFTLTLKALENILNEEFLGFESRKVPATGSGLIPRQKMGRIKTDS